MDFWRVAITIVLPVALWYAVAALVLFAREKPDERSRQVSRGVLCVLAVALAWQRVLSPGGAVLLAAALLLTLRPTWWRYATHPHEFLALLRFRFLHAIPGIPAGVSADQRYSYEKLQQVSRSFSAVILHLHPKLREAIAIFYLVCRGLDTVEDDMKPPIESKVKELRAFHQHLGEARWTLTGYGDVSHEIDLLVHFDRVNSVYAGFPGAYKEVIADIARRMGHGMADYLTKRVESLAEYDEYCYYVAGLVGEGLTRLFVAAQLEDASLGRDEGVRLSVAMGLFLQKTNIIRDYLEDISAVNPRMFYPGEIWRKHVSSLEALKDREQRPAALACLNEMVTNALAHAPDSVAYMSRLKEPTVFAFCAIPQTMAMATLALCYNNGRVFEGEVKICKGEAVHLMLTSSNMAEVKAHFRSYAHAIGAQIPSGDPSAAKLRSTLQEIVKRLDGATS